MSTFNDGLRRRLFYRPEARRVRRILYGFELWSVLKVSLLFFLCVWGIFLLAGALLWNFVNSSGYIERFEDFILEIFNYESFTINGEQIFQWYFWGGLFAVLLSTCLTVILCLFYNLISVLVGGVRVTLVEEETVRLQPNLLGKTFRLKAKEMPTETQPPQAQPLAPPPPQQFPQQTLPQTPQHTAQHPQVPHPQVPQPQIHQTQIQPQAHPQAQQQMWTDSTPAVLPPTQAATQTAPPPPAPQPPQPAPRRRRISRR